MENAPVVCDQPCPNHPSVIIREKRFGGGRVSYYCDEGCNTTKILAALAQPETNGHSNGNGNSLAVTSVHAPPETDQQEHPPRAALPFQRQEDTWLARVPPHNLDAEKGVLGAILLRPEVIEQVAPILKVDDIYHEHHRMIYDAMVGLHQTRTAIDAITLGAVLVQRGQLERIGGARYLIDLAEYVPTAAHAKIHAEMIRDQAIKRDIIVKATRIATLAYDGVTADALAGEIERVLRPSTQTIEVSRPQLLTYADSKRLADEAGSREHIIQDMLTVEDISGLAAKKGIGKSTLLRTVAVAVSRGDYVLGLPTNQTKVWYLDLEPGSQQARHQALEALGWDASYGALTLTACPPVAGQPWAFEWLEENIVKHGFGLIIIDTLFKFCKIDQGNDYSSGLYGSAPLEGIVKRTKCHIMIAHHAPKNANPNNVNASAADLFLGAVSIAGSFGVCMAMRRSKGGDGGSRVSLFMDAPRYTKQVIDGEWILVKDPISNAISLGETVKKDWWNRAQADVMGAARGMAKPFTITELLHELEDYKRAELARIVRYLVKDKQLEDIGKEARRGGAVQFRIPIITAVTEAQLKDRRLFD